MRTWAGVALAVVFLAAGSNSALAAGASQDQINAVINACNFNQNVCGVPVNVSSGDPTSWYNAAGCLVDHKSSFSQSCISTFNSTCGRNGDGCIAANRGGGDSCGDSATGCAPELIAARQKIFGVENVDTKTGEVRNDKVIFSWITNASFAASVLGRVILLDTYVTRLEAKPTADQKQLNRTPFTIQDLVDLHPEGLFLGHGHFDHADNAAYIALLTGANIYASPETCDNMQIDAANILKTLGQSKVKGTSVNCTSITSRGSLPGSEVVNISQLEPVASITAFKHLHSTNTSPPDNSFPTQIINPAPGSGSPPAPACPANASDGTPAPCNVANPRDAALFPKGTAEPLIPTIQTSRAGQGGPISIFYHFIVRGGNNFTFNWHNTTGAIRDGCALPNNVAGTSPAQPSQPGQNAQGCFGKAVGDKLASLMESLRPTDVEIGSVVSLGYNINGERDIVDYNTHIAPKVFIPNHVTAVAVEGSSLEWKVGYLNQQNAMKIPQSQRPELIWLVDPNDYLRPIVFDPKDPAWSKNSNNNGK